MKGISPTPAGIPCSLGQLLHMVGGRKGWAGRLVARPWDRTGSGAGDTTTRNRIRGGSMPKRRGGETEEFRQAPVRSERTGDSARRDDLPEKSGLRLVRPAFPAVGLLESKLGPPAGPAHSIPRKALLAKLRR